METLYRNAASSDEKEVASSFTFSSDMIRDALKNIYSKKFHPMTDIEENMFDAAWKTLNMATDKGFGARPAEDPDEDFIREIKRNNAVFAAFKVHRAQNDMARLLLDKNGNLKPFEKWAEEVIPIADHQMIRWLRTEYDTAVIRAHRATDWRQFEREKDVLPNLEWMPSTSIHPGEDHRIFWGTIRPIDDPFWNVHRPGDRWNCKCGLKSTDKPVTAIPDGGKDYDPAPGLENNPGRDAKLFSDNHPYRKEAYPGAKEAVDKLMKRIDDMIREMPDNLTDDEKIAIAKNNLEIEKVLNITKGKPMSVDKADKQNANPKYKEEYISDPNGMYKDKAGNRYSKNPDYKPSDKQYRINCQTCSPAYVLRLRGFEITAKGKTPGSLSEYLSKQHSFETWNNADGSPSIPILTNDWMVDKGYKQMTEKRYFEFFNECCKEEGVYILTIGWRGGGGHATILQRFANGELKRIEPQQYKEKLGAKRSIDSLCELGEIKPVKTRGVLRVDNKLFNTKFMSIFDK